MLEGIEKHVNKTIMISEQNDSPRNHPKEDHKLKEIIKVEFHNEANKIGHKVNLFNIISSTVFISVVSSFH